MTEVFHLVALRFISLCSAKGKIRKDQIDKSFVSQHFVKTWRQWTRLYSSNTHKQFNTMSSENTLEAQWVGLHDLTAKDAGSIPGWGNSCKSLSMAKKKKNVHQLWWSILYCCSAFSFPLYKHQHFKDTNSGFGIGIQRLIHMLWLDVGHFIWI